LLKFYKKEDVRILEFIASKMPFLKDKILYLARIVERFSE